MPSDSSASSDSPITTFDSEVILAEFGGRETFAPYADYLLAENQKINLVSRETTSAELYRLIADCLIPFKTDELAKTLKSGIEMSIMDIGTGGGLPGIPLALALLSLGIKPHLTLVERTLKKARFLERALEKLELDGQVVAHDFVTSVKSGSLQKATGAFDLISLRWVKPDSKLIGLILAALKPTGRFVYYAALPPGVSLKTDRSVPALTLFSYKLVGDERERRTLTLLCP